MNLERAKNRALDILAKAVTVKGDTTTLNEVTLEPYDRHIWLGVGYCVGKGLATYRGDNNYAITMKGLDTLPERQSEATEEVESDL